MHTPHVWPVVSVCIAACAISLSAAAQQAAGNTPPRLDKLEEADAPAITVRGSAIDRKIIEKRERGTVASVKVTSGNSTYYLKPNTPAGSALRGDTQSDAVQAPQWQVLEFDWNRPQDEQVQAAATVPSPPAPSFPVEKK